jgi:hypothetical protein
MINLNREDALYAGNKFIQYMSKFSSIEEYFRMKKIERINAMPATLDGYGFEDDMFSDFTVHPKDMDFDIVALPSAQFDTMLEMTASFTYENSPGKELKLGIRERNSRKYVGFIKLASPLINSKPRNDWLGGVPDLSIFNRHAMMGYIIVPAQPFGFNYLGGKLLALICTSHEVREMINKKYPEMNTCLFETTSLYGSIKGTSQYDGLKPFLRHSGDTESKFMLTLSDDFYDEMNAWFITRNDNKPLLPKDTSSRKLKTQTMMVGDIKRSLKEHDSVKYAEFVEAVKSSTDITTQKRFYMSTYGYDNSREVLLGQTDKLIPNKENHDKHYMSNITEWWKRKATSRFETLQSEGRIRMEQEIWNADTMDKIDIIR